MTQNMQEKINENKVRFLKELKDELEQENTGKAVPKAEVKKSAIAEDDDSRYELS
ncbi:hypothetical protein [Thalassomonas haliotis]|uniref:Uncharacterized protein n=1 Tax=Thalassomonas haliotis TaxID=485448 RepID=A0ABY7VLH9_9GAMM|nr:hypothetical protein [Thalassomonas haliotis]WDE14343.1 hypothetical protein H3N35_13505 [Thalassomonas haliotis]